MHIVHERSKKRSAHKRQQKVVLAGRVKPAQCEACGEATNVVWDHDHSTCTFRGWICEPCNKALGMVRDSPTHLRLLANYAEQHGFGPGPYADRARNETHALELTFQKS